MKWLLKITHIAILLLLTGAVANAANLPLTGTLGSASVNNPGAGAVVYTTPPAAKGTFVLTSLCVGGASVELLAGLAFVAELSPGSCQLFNPGFVVSPGTKIICAGVGGLCSISWILAPPSK